MSAAMMPGAGRLALSSRASSFSQKMSRFGEALRVRTRVENLQSSDLGSVLLDVVTEGSNETLGLRLGGSIEAGRDDGIDGDGVDGLLGILLGLGEGVAQGGQVERSAGGVGELLAGRGQLIGRGFTQEFIGRHRTIAA